MKKLLLLLFSAFFLQMAYAQFQGDGFYRVQNRDTERYLTVINNRADVNMHTNKPDLASILPIRSFDRIAGNPGSIIYIDHVSGSNYTLRAQGSDTYDMLGMYLHLRQTSDQSYLAYATYKGVTQYLCDEATSYDEGWLYTGEKTRNWYIIPVDNTTDNYFGISPEIAYSGAHYTTMYASFAYQSTNEGTEMYSVSKVDGKYAVISPVVNNYVPAATPVLIKCASASHADNKVEISVSGGTAVTTNHLKGVYFNFYGKQDFINRVAYDSNTMRVLGLTSTGKLGFITADIDYLPANKAYLVVPAGSPSELEIVTEEEYEASNPDPDPDPDPAPDPDPDPDPVPEPSVGFSFVTDSIMELSADGGLCTIIYSILHPDSQYTISATTDVSWISSINCSNVDKQMILFNVAQNKTTNARSGKIFVGYDNTYVVTIKQAGQPVDTAIDELTTDDNRPVVYYDLFGRKVTNPQRGVYVNSKGKKVIFK